MKGTLFFVAFFFIFATSVYFIPTPMFPSDVILNRVSASTLPQATFLGALINGITYSLIAWAFFAIAMRRIGSEPRSSSQSARSG